jgi:hypothetical protein
MTALLIAEFTTEPWSLLFLGVALFVLSALARRRQLAATSATAIDAVVTHSPAAVFGPRAAAPIAPLPQAALRQRLQIRLQ